MAKEQAAIGPLTKFVFADPATVERWEKFKANTMEYVSKVRGWIKEPIENTPDELATWLVKYSGHLPYLGALLADAEKWRDTAYYERYFYWRSTGESNAGAEALAEGETVDYTYIVAAITHITEALSDARSGIQSRVNMAKKEYDATPS